VTAPGAGPKLISGSHEKPTEGCAKSASVVILTGSKYVVNNLTVDLQASGSAAVK
jgi:hypothetical protein